MCTCQYKLHWSVVSIIVNIVSIAMFLTAVATPHWAELGGDAPVSAGLFQACLEVNKTCLDTNYHFDAYTLEKAKIMAGAVLCIFALIGMLLFFALSIFFLCGLFEEKQLATGAVITAYSAGILGLIGIILYSDTLRNLNYKLGWSFVIGVLALVVNFAAGVLMCVGRNISTTKKRKKKKKKRRNEQVVEEVQMDEAHQTKAMKVWSST